MAKTWTCMLFTGMGNMTNQFKFKQAGARNCPDGTGQAVSKDRFMFNPWGRLLTAIAKQILKEKGSLKLGLRDIFYTQQVKGNH